jgi:flavin-dependent dehydrogenase
MDDVLIVGAGPAGAVAATVLARAGARVRVVDRASFPRDKLCGDTLNPGCLALLRTLQLAGALEGVGLDVAGMLVTGEGGVAVEGRYPHDLRGRSIRRRDLDWALLGQAIAAGARFEPGVTVREAVTIERGGVRIVDGVTVGSRESAHRLRARVTIAADGRRSTLAFGLGLARHPLRPRRWAIGAYFEAGPEGRPPSHDTRAVSGTRGILGEMHIRRGHYIGVAPVPGGMTNVCIVKPSAGGDVALRNPESALRVELEADPVLRDRFAGARLVHPPVVLGPLAVDATGEAVDGLLLAGDAAGFIDPMTGDGLSFALRGGELAGAAALRALEHGWAGVHAQLVEDRRRAFAGKWRFNRALRSLVASPSAVRTAAAAARIAPGAVRAVIARAGDCDLAMSRLQT